MNNEEEHRIMLRSINTLMDVCETQCEMIELLKKRVQSLEEMSYSYKRIKMYNDEVY